MKLSIGIVAVAGLLALSASSALGQGKPEGIPPNGNGNGNGPVYNPGNPNPGNPNPGPGATLPEKAKAYGRYCQGESKKHVQGEKGTAFSRCVTAMAKAANDDNLTPGQACKGQSKKHVKGEKGTAFSRCVKAAVKMRHEQQQSSS